MENDEFRETVFVCVRSNFVYGLINKSRVPDKLYVLRKLSRLRPAHSVTIIDVEGASRSSELSIGCQERTLEPSQTRLCLNNEHRRL